MPLYHTLEKYMVNVRPALKQVDIYTAEPTYDTDPFVEPMKFQKGKLIQSLKNYKKVWVGDNLAPSVKQPKRMAIGTHYEPKGKYPGNTVLVQTANDSYVFIGRSRIQVFKLPEGESVIKYVSPVNGQEVSHPYIIGKQKLFFLDYESIPYLPKELFDLTWDAYLQRWDYGGEKHLLKIRRPPVKRPRSISPAERRKKAKKAQEAMERFFGRFRARCRSRSRFRSRSRSRFRNLSRCRSQSRFQSRSRIPKRR